MTFDDIRNMELGGEEREGEIVPLEIPVPEPDPVEEPEEVEVPAPK